MTCLAEQPVWRYNRAMQHRHLTHEQYTLAAIDDIIARGKRRNSTGLRQAALADRSLFAKVMKQRRGSLLMPPQPTLHIRTDYFGPVEPA